MHEVNDIVYSTLPDSGKIVPLKVIEVQIVKRESSEEVKYKVKVPSKNEKTYCLSKFNSVFNSIEDIKSYLTNNATKAINKMVDEAIELEEKYFVNKEKVNTEEIKLDEEHTDQAVSDVKTLDKEDDYIKVDLGNGQVGKIKPDFAPWLFRINYKCKFNSF